MYTHGHFFKCNTSQLKILLSFMLLVMPNTHNYFYYFYTNTDNSKWNTEISINKMKF